MSSVIDVFIQYALKKNLSLHRRLKLAEEWGGDKNIKIINLKSYRLDNLKLAIYSN